MIDYPDIGPDAAMSFFGSSEYVAVEYGKWVRFKIGANGEFVPE